MIAYISEEARQIHHDVKHCSPDEILTLHGIEINDDGTVYCTTALKTYKNLDAWIVENAVADYEGIEKFSRHEEHDYF